MNGRHYRSSSETTTNAKRHRRPWDQGQVVSLPWETSTVGQAAVDRPYVWRGLENPLARKIMEQMG